MASIRNCWAILRRVAPNDLRTPISRVRSVTEGQIGAIKGDDRGRSIVDVDDLIGAGKQAEPFGTVGGIAIPVDPPKKAEGLPNG